MKTKTYVGIMILIVGILCMIPTTSAQDLGILINPSNVTIEENKSLSVDAVFLQKDLDYVSPAPATPYTGFVATNFEAYPASELFCWNFNEKEWEPSPNNALKNACRIDMNAANSTTAFYTNFTQVPEQPVIGKESGEEGEKQEVIQLIVSLDVNDDQEYFDYVSLEYASIQEGKNDFKIQHHYDVAGLDHNDLIQMLVWATIMLIAIFNNWIFVAVVAMLPLFYPIFDNVGAPYPINFTAGVFLVTLTIFLRKYAEHWGERFTGWLRS